MRRDATTEETRAWPCHAPALTWQARCPTHGEGAVDVAGTTRLTLWALGRGSDTTATSQKAQKSVAKEMTIAAASNDDVQSAMSPRAGGRMMPPVAVIVLKRPMNCVLACGGARPALKETMMPPSKPLPQPYNMEANRNIVKSLDMGKSANAAAIKMSAGTLTAFRPRSGRRRSA